MTRPPHHAPSGRFRNPWPIAAADDDMRKRVPEMLRERYRDGLPPVPRPEELPRGEPDPAYPHATSEVRVTWVGHATFLLQLPGLNVLTDPIWSRKASPVPFLGPARFVPPAPLIDELPQIHAVLLSHDHYDHLDVPTVRRLHARFGQDMTWLTPLGYRSWFDRLGVRRVVELDWWQASELPGGRFEAIAAPARHWTRRTLRSTNQRLWASWAVIPRAAAAGPSETGNAASGEPGARVYFAGDTAYAPHFSEIRERLGSFHVNLLPVGAYEPRWFMKVSHMNPEEAVRGYLDLGGTGTFVPSHWGTFQLTTEPPLDPPRRTERAWRDAGLPRDRLRTLRHGETAIFRGPGAEPR
jgi:N-acyl-phosphatidylethanolamine-hydrolysing phospholipase D